MSFIENFTQFFENSDPARQAEIAAVLQSIMAGDAIASGLTPEQLMEDDRRFNDPENKPVDIAELEARLDVKLLP